MAMPYHDLLHDASHIALSVMPAPEHILPQEVCGGKAM